jgi:hypothetical protein
MKQTNVKITPMRILKNFYQKLFFYKLYFFYKLNLSQTKQTKKLLKWFKINPLRQQLLNGVKLALIDSIMFFY